MKIAVSATAPNLDAEVEPRFGRCPYFIIVDPDTMQFEAVENSSAMASGGAGIASGQVIAGKGVRAVLTGNCGPNAYQVLSAAGIAPTSNEHAPHLNKHFFHCPSLRCVGNRPIRLSAAKAPGSSGSVAIPGRRTVDGG